MILPANAQKNFAASRVDPLAALFTRGSSAHLRYAFARWSELQSQKP